MNVQDVTATVSYILRDKDNMIPNFGFAEADVNYNNNVEIADVIGIVNLIHGKPVTKAVHCVLRPRFPYKWSSTLTIS